MQKKLIALAVAAVFSAPAFADTANVTVYGKAFLTLDSINSNQAGRDFWSRRGWHHRAEIEMYSFINGDNPNA